jgi:cytochrome c peroxidase
MNTKRLLAGGLCAALLLAGALPLWFGGDEGVRDARSEVGYGDVATLRTAFENWRAAYESKGGSPERLKLGLGYSKALSERYTQARGRLELNLLDGALSFRAAGLDRGEYDLWFVDNRPGTGNSAKPEAADRLLRIGRLKAEQGRAALETRLNPEQLSGFVLDTVALTEAGKSPVEGLLISGSADLLQKLYYADQPWTAAEVGDLKHRAEHRPAPFEFLLPKVAQADAAADLGPILGPLVAQGRQLFHKETFGGNGRTCGTCHREDNNFTLDPNFIMDLPRTDPLFVAETNPALAGLENPTLMRKYGLILTHVDGPGVDVFRSVPHTLSLATSIASETMAGGGEFAQDEQFANATGWSGDGAPGSGSLREFTLGAVAQHLPKTLNRQAGADFRVPTADELDAIQAYLLSLGRSKDYPVYQLHFADTLTQAGKVLFDTKQNPCSNGADQKGNPAVCPSGQTVVQGQTANCNGCHQNAGGRSSTTNANPTRNTGVERMNIHPARLVKPDLPYDGGFGQTASQCGPKGDQPCYGDGRFNTTPLIEAADTAPFFHNNAVSTLEEAIASYNSDAFNTSQGALTSKLADRRVKLDSTQVVAVASFLRAVNALENLRLSDRLDTQAMQVAAKGKATALELARLGYKENQDAIRVLKEGVLGNYWKVVQKLEAVADLQGRAQKAQSRAARNRLLRRGLARKQEARAMIATCDPNAPVPSTVVVPPAGSLYTCAELGL